MSVHGKLERLKALYDALRSQRPRPDPVAAWFTASALLPADGPPDALAARTQTLHAALADRIGRHSAPSGGLRWAYAAILVRAGTDVEHFAALRDAVRDGREASKTGALHAGGSRAALVLSAGALEPAEAARRFFAMKQAINPRWWRRAPSVTDTYAAAHAVGEDDPRTVQRARERAEAVFGARVAVLNGEEPRMVLKRFHELDTVRKRERVLRHRVSRELALTWAAEGLTGADLEQIGQILQQTPRGCGGGGRGRAQLAYLVHTSDRAGATPGAVSALAAVIAAQTAAVVAATSAVTVATAASN